MRRALDRYLDLCERRPGLLVALAALVAALALGCSLRLALRTDMAELLPRDHPSVAALHRLAEHERLGSSLIVLVHSPDREAAIRFLAALRPRLERLEPDVFAEIDWGPDQELASWKRRWQWLYADDRSIARAEDLLDRLLLEHTSPLAVAIDDDPKEELRGLKHELDAKLPAISPSPYFEGMSGAQHLFGVTLWRRGRGLASGGDHQALAAVRAAVADTHPTQFDSALRVRFTGHVAQAIEEQDSVREDLTVATCTCTALILLVIYAFFRRIAVVLVIGAPAVFGLFIALAIASFSLGSLNLNTAFLISIILGNGINFPIILLARYGEERTGGGPFETALRAAVHGSIRGTLAAMAAASVAYGSLLATRFRGLSQFGWLGGTGMVLVWLATFLLLPPALHLGERFAPGLLTPRESRWRRPFAWLGELASAHPRRVISCALVVGIVAAVPLYRLVANPIEWDLRKLRPQQTPARDLWQAAEALGMTNPDTGYVGSHGALIVDDAAQTDVVAEALRAQDHALGDPVFERVRTWSSLLPKDQPQKLETLARIRRKVDRIFAWVRDDERRDLAALRPPDELRVLEPRDLPAAARRAFTERDGTVGRFVLMSVDRANYSDWNGHDLLRLARHLRVDALGRTWVAASSATVFAGMIETLLDDGPRVAAIAALGVVTFVLVVLGARRAVPALATQALGLVWFGGLLGALHMKINFFNFVALPITFGVGADYAANILARLHRASSHSLGDVIGTVGSAVALCSLTTVIGYSSLLFSSNPALRSFGQVADLGEVCCLVAALLVLPALWCLPSGDFKNHPVTREITG